MRQRSRPLPAAFIEAAVTPLWQQTSQPVTITAVVTETDLLYLGDVWAEVSGPDPATRHLEPGDPWQADFTGGLEGTYTASVSAQDRAGNVARVVGGVRHHGVDHQCRGAI